MMWFTLYDIMRFFIAHLLLMYINRLRVV